MLDHDLDYEMPHARLALLLQEFSRIDDDREPHRVMYPLKEVLLLVTCATICSCDDFDDIALWGKHNIAFPRRFSEFYFGVPCARWLRILFNRIDAKLFARCFEAWIAALWPERHDLIAIDGKTARRTHGRRKGLKALHTLNAYASTARLVLAQTSVPEKTNEITAIPDLLDQLAEAKQFQGAIVPATAPKHGGRQTFRLQPHQERNPQAQPKGKGHRKYEVKTKSRSMEPTIPPHNPQPQLALTRIPRRGMRIVSGVVR
jgi:hypothetical protein